MPIEVTIYGRNDEFVTFEVDTIDFFEAQTMAWEIVRIKQVHFKNNVALSLQFQKAYTYQFKLI